MVVSVHPVRHPFNFIDTRDTIGIIYTRAAIGVFQPAPFGIVSILDAFYIRDEISLCTTLRQPRFWQASQTRMHRCCFLPYQYYLLLST